MRFAKHNKNNTKTFISAFSIKISKYHCVNEINLFNLKILQTQARTKTYLT